MFTAKTNARGFPKVAAMGARNGEDKRFCHLSQDAVAIPAHLLAALDGNLEILEGFLTDVANLGRNLLLWGRRRLRGLGGRA